MHLSSIDLNLLVILDSLLRLRSVKETAAEVARSPSAVSHALGRLRVIMDDPLLVRAGRRLVLTPRSERLAPQVHAAIQAIEAALVPEPDFDPSRLRRGFSVGSTDLVELLIGAPLSARVARQAPGVDLYFRPLGRLPLTDLRRPGHDLSVGVFDHPPDDVSTSPVFVERFVCILRRGHPSLRDGQLSLRDYVTLDHILVSPGGGVTGAMDRHLADIGEARRVARTVGSFSAASWLVAASDHIATISSRAARLYADRLELEILPLPLEVPPYTVQQAWHRRLDADPGHRWLRAELAAVGQSLGPMHGDGPNEDQSAPDRA